MYFNFRYAIKYIVLCVLCTYVSRYICVSLRIRHCYLYDDCLQLANLSKTFSLMMKIKCKQLGSQSAANSSRLTHATAHTQDSRTTRNVFSTVNACLRVRKCVFACFTKLSCVHKIHYTLRTAVSC